MKFEEFVEGAASTPDPDVFWELRNKAILPIVLALLQNDSIDHKDRTVYLNEFTSMSEAVECDLLDVRQCAAEECGDEEGIKACAKDRERWNAALRHAAQSEDPRKT